MPELPEVETFKNYINKNVQGKEIQDVIIEMDKFLKNVTPDEFKTALIGNKIDEVKRRAKFLVFKIGEYTVLSHLRMEGNFTYYPENYEPKKHDYIKFLFTDGSWLVYNDSRQFGTIDLYRGDNYQLSKQISKLGPEPWDEEYNAKYLLTKLEKRSVAIKTLLLDQAIVSGIGNIYADEILWACKIHPIKPGNEITLEECECIVDQTRQILENSIKAGGTTIRSYTPGEGNVGKYVVTLNVYGKDGEFCPRDGEIISKMKVNGRGTHFCGVCQKR